MINFLKKHPVISFGITTILVVVGAFLVFGGFEKKEKTSATVKSGALIRSVQVEGSVVRGAEYTLSFAESGVVDAVFVWPGKKVSKGELLVSLSNSKERAAYTKAQAALLKAQTKYRTVASGSAKVLPEEVDSALATVVFAQAAAENARADLEKTRVRAQMDAVVVSTAVRAGATVTPGTAVVTLRDTANNYIEAELSDEDALFVARGQELITSIGNDTVRGVIVGLFKKQEGYIVTSILSGEYTVGTKTVSKIITAQLDTAIIIPRIALSESAEGYSVELVVGERKTKTVPVVVGLTGDDGLIQIADGLAEGDRIVWEKTEIEVSE